MRIKDNKKGDSGDYTRVFSERVTYIIKHFANLGYKSWSFVPKDELCICVVVRKRFNTIVIVFVLFAGFYFSPNDFMLANVIQSDFVIDWNRMEDQLCMKSQMHEAFKSYKYKLHSIWKKFKS